MDTAKLAKLAIPVAGILLIGGVAIVRSLPARAPVTEERAKPAPVALNRPTTSSPRPEKPPPLASGDVIARATDEARLISTYQNFRTAVATGNRVLEDNLRQVLSRDRDAALALAQQEVHRASDPTDRSIALRTLESLRK